MLISLLVAQVTQKDIDDFNTSIRAAGTVRAPHGPCGKYGPCSNTVALITSGCGY